MRKVMIKVLAFIVVVGGLVTVFWPVANWRLYDANWRPLAMTDAEAHCAGWVFGETQKNEPMPDAMAKCITESDMDNERPHTGNIVRIGCKAFFALTGYPVDQCESVFEANGLWWLADGGFTWEWNDSHQRPQVYKTDIVNTPSRDGDRDSSEREGAFRP